MHYMHAKYYAKFMHIFLCNKIVWTVTDNFIFILIIEMASNMKGFTFNSDDLYGDLVKAHIKIHHLEEALKRGEKTFCDNTNLL